MALLEKQKWPEEGVEQLRAQFKSYLVQEEGYYKHHIDGEASGQFSVGVWPEGLKALRNDCEQRAPGDANKGILYSKGPNNKFQYRYDLFEPIRHALEPESDATDPIWKALVTLRMMQLNLAGDQDWKNIWYESLMYETKRLFKLVFKSKDGTNEWDTAIANNKFEEMCGACGIYGRKKWKQDRMTVVPCSKNHTIHTGDVAEYFKNQKTCPDCGEIVL